MFDSFLNGDFGRAPTNFPALILGLLLSLAGGHVLAWVYMVTHSGLSYSRSFVKSLIVMPVVVALVMHVLANNIITAMRTSLMSLSKTEITPLPISSLS